MDTNPIIDFFLENEHKGFKYDNEIGIKKGTNNVLISAPHAYSHIRDNIMKAQDNYTYTISQILAALTEAHVILLSKPATYDPNWDDKNNHYCEAVLKYIKENNIEYFIDLHGMSENDKSDFDICINGYDNVNGDEDLIKEIINILQTNEVTKVTVDEIYQATSKTLSYKVNHTIGIKAMQFELSEKYRQLRKDEETSADILNALIDIIVYLENKDRYEVMTYKDKLSKKEDIKKIYYAKDGNKVFNYAKVFDRILDIKPLFGYERKLKLPIPYNHVGLELEVSVTLERDKYSLIKKLLTNIKNIVGNHGYFVKDATILGDYGFEIVLDPLSSNDIYHIYSSLLEVFEFSNDLIKISKNKNCGIHMNFNKHDVTDLNEAHKRLTSLLTEGDKYFEQNIYKQIKFIWDYTKYCEFQSKIGSKYIWVNYLKSSVIEVRNIKTGLNTLELIKIIDLILNALYYDKNNGKFAYQNYTTLSEIYNTALNKNQADQIFNNINNTGFLLLNVEEGNVEVVDIDAEIINAIKKEKKEEEK